MVNSVLLLESNMKLQLELENLVIFRDNESASYPLKNTECIIMDNMNCSITCRLLTKLAELNVVLIITDKKHLPVGLYYPYAKYSRSTKMLLKQIETINYNGYLWKKIVVAKIRNQAKTLEILGFDMDVVNRINGFINEVEDGDITNKEAVVAKTYFYTLMNCSFTRGNDDILLNSALNYAYAIIRSTIAKIGVGFGLNMQLGIHHKSEYNEFNLADDLIEPFRAIVDLYAYKLMKDEEFFTASHRRDLVNILYKKINYMGKNMDLYDAILEYVTQYARFIKEGVVDIVFPLVENVEFANNDYQFEHYIAEFLLKDEEEDEI